MIYGNSDFLTSMGEFLTWGHMNASLHQWQRLQMMMAHHYSTVVSCWWGGCSKFASSSTSLCYFFVPRGRALF